MSACTSQAVRVRLCVSDCIIMSVCTSQAACLRLHVSGCMSLVASLRLRVSGCISQSVRAVELLTTSTMIYVIRLISYNIFDFIFILNVYDFHIFQVFTRLPAMPFCTTPTWTLRTSPWTG